MILNSIFHLVFKSYDQKGLENILVFNNLEFGLFGEHCNYLLVSIVSLMTLPLRHMG
jgi:hypothetical protein